MLDFGSPTLYPIPSLGECQAEGLAVTWQAMAAQIETRAKTLCALLRNPLPFGGERWILGIDDVAWLEAQYSEARGLLVSLEQKQAPLGGAESFLVRCELWCARLDRELTHRQRQKIFLDVGRRLLLSGLGLLLLVALQLLIEHKLVRGILDPVFKVIGPDGLQKLMAYVITGAALSAAVAIAIHLFKAKRPRLGAVLQALLWSPFTLLLIVLAGGLGKVSATVDGNDVPELLTIQFYVQTIALTVGYALPILLKTLKSGRYWKGLDAGRVILTRNMLSALNSIPAALRGKLPKAASPPESPQQSGSPLPW
ncbi:membrane hypothetical protein [Magnetospirillum sp. LM-5]|uniref:hypothetical protein n=1 Tax=Magnetospirillum sp. LM-5 TaxID=2681466 RepID=UPI001384D706|nr:hypothetical protein [Magnetospirillum sp. LM-5]CAA7622985.1 membrane hypothetical protein [Magnetospirillum sp. LM-5]